jgi:3alpha(or 20beta)-hydroxysteroid dehydrogenase
MGASHARTLVEDGASVVIADVLDGPGQALAAGLGARARYIHLDVTDEVAWIEAVQKTVEEFGGLDILVNNAGIAVDGAVHEMLLTEWDRVIAINLTGMFLGIKTASAVMIPAGRGSIINISSTAGLSGYQNCSAYSAAKFGIRGLTKSAAIELGRFGIRVNSIHPGVIRTPMDEGRDRLQTNVALHRTGQPAEVSQMVLFLASDDSPYATGAEFVIDSGETAGMAYFD